MFSNRYYKGKKSDHFDGRRFFNPSKSDDNLNRKFWRWFCGREKAVWPKWVNSKFLDSPPARVEGIRISFVGHATFLIQTAGLNILTDPFFSYRASPFRFVGPKRVTNPGIEFDKLPPIDIVLVSHNHYDHLDKDTLKKLWQHHKPRIITTLGNDVTINSIDKSIKSEAYDWGEYVNITENLSIHIDKAMHWSSRKIYDRNHALWCSFIIKGPGGNIYFVGDTAYGDGDYFRHTRDKHGPIKIAILPIGDYKPRWLMKNVHMNPHEAVKAHIDLKASYSIASHFATIKLGDQSYLEDLAELRAALEHEAIPEEEFRALCIGEAWKF